MPSQVTKDTSPADVEKYADEYVDLLKKSGLPADRAKIIGDMQKRAAGLHSMTVAEWEAMWAAKAAPPPPPPVTPEPTKPKEAPKPPAKKERGVVREIDPNYFFITPENKADIQTWLALNDAGVQMHMLAVGPAGCGKTSVFNVIGKEADLPVYKVDCAAVTTPDRWLGHKDVQITSDGPQTVYVLSEFLRWISGDGFPPGICVLDEISRTPPVILNILMSILDGSQSIWIPELGIHVKVDPRTRFAATANIGVGFTGTFGLDQALVDRFGSILEFTFPPASDEINVLVKRTGIDDESARKLVEIARQSRAKAAEGTLSKPVSTRGLINAGHWVNTGRSIMEAAEATFVKQFSEEGQGSSERTMVRLILQGIAGK